MREGKVVKVRTNRGAMPDRKREKATFLIHVLYQENNSWQGEVVWADTQKRQYFRSALELIRLMDSVLTEESSRTFE